MLLIMSVVACQQQQVRSSKYQVQCHALPSSIPGADDILLVAPMITDIPAIGAAETLELSAVITNTLNKRGFGIAQADTRSLPEGGLLLYTQMSNALVNGQLGPRALQDIKQRYATVQWLLVAQLEAMAVKQYADAGEYATLQTIRIRYGLWHLSLPAQGMMSSVSGYDFQGNERMLAKQGSVLQKEFANAVYRLLTDGQPQVKSLPDLLRATTENWLDTVSGAKACAAPD